jgi:hypothetical protein
MTMQAQQGIERAPISARMRRRFGRVAATVIVMLGLTLGLTPYAHAGGPLLWASSGSIGHRLTVCADSLSVRHTRGGAAFAILNRPQTFTVENVDQEFGSEWVWGFAWGNVNAHGYVQNGWFCLT